MTLAQMVNTVRRRHNAESDSFFADAEIYELITNRCNEVLSVIGLLEATDTSNTSTAATQAINYPTDASMIRQVNYKSDRLKRIDFRKWEQFKNGTTTVSGTPTMWVPWNRQILLVPIPDTTADAITIYYYKTHPYIDNSTQMTVDVPAVLHPHIANGVIADMFAKDLNQNLAQYYEGKWAKDGMTAFYKYKAMEMTATGFMPIGDADSDDYTSTGLT